MKKMIDSHLWAAEYRWKTYENFQRILLIKSIELANVFRIGIALWSIRIKQDCVV